VPLAPAARDGDLPRLVTLTTDFGLDDPFVGLMKAAILRHCPTAQVVDLTHAVPPFDVEAGAFWIERCAAWFPPGGVHACVVDPGVGTARRILLVEHAQQVFLGPDNGLLDPLASRPGAIARAVGDAFLQSAGLAGASATFHGRDIFGPLAGMLAAGRCLPADVGTRVTDWVRPGWPGPRRRPDAIVGRVIWVDRFGNCFSNLDASFLAECEDWSVVVGGRALPLVRTYGDRPAGTLVALVNAFGVVEAACVGGRGDRALDIGPGAAFELRHGPA
jgi:S-adenosylmethionine hydrolase